MINSRKFELKVAHLRWRCDPESFDFETTSELKPLNGIIGQKRALTALQLGLELKSPGFNICVVGLTGTGRTTIIKSILERFGKATPVPDDFVFVNNFRDADRPRLISMPAGKGRRFARDMERMINYLLKSIPERSESKQFKQKQQTIISQYAEKEAGIVNKTESLARKKGFTIIQVQDGSASQTDVYPVIEDKPLPVEKLDTLVRDGKITAEQASGIRESVWPLRRELDEAMSRVRVLARKMENDLRDFEFEFYEPIIKEEIGELRKKYAFPSVDEYLDEVLDFLLNDLELFRNTSDKASGAPESLHRYRVNVLVDNSKLKNAPIIEEKVPTFCNLFGAIDRQVDATGRAFSDFMDIKSGSLIRANGGYLIINLPDALTEQGVWRNLKRALKHKQLTVQDPTFSMSFVPSGLKPEEIPLNLKVVLIGDEYSYEALCDLDEEFLKIFKVKAEFDDSIPRSNARYRQYAAFLRKLSQEENLPPFDRSAVAMVLEFAVRMTEWNKKLSTRFGEIADLARESAYWQRKAGAAVVAAEHVLKAERERQSREQLTEDRMLELQKEDYLLIDTKGAKVGQVNGLSVYQTGNYTFGKPNRITAVTSPGRAGIINIEREVKLSGKTHDKGVLIIEGYLRQRYAQQVPLSLCASICFEQSYSWIEGDSASSTEVYALLSALSSLPLRQDLAVTGSINQKGEIQPIGGVNEKIEGFFRLCKARGLTGTQGVIIPLRNVPNLMLDFEVLEAVREGRFHIYHIRHVDEGISLLTDTTSGKARADGSFPARSVNGLVMKCLDRYAQAIDSSEGSDYSADDREYEPDEPKPIPAETPDFSEDEHDEDNEARFLAKRPLLRLGRNGSKVAARRRYRQLRKDFSPKMR